MPCYVFVLGDMTASADLPACFSNMHVLQSKSLCLRNNFFVSQAKERRERLVFPLAFVAFFFNRIAQEGANFIE